MTSIFQLILIALCLCEVQLEVLELDESFIGFWNNGTEWLINFYAPWCGHCRRLHPIYDEVSQKLAALAPSLRVAKLDASSHRTVAKKFNIDGFPTLKFIHSSRSCEHDGERNTRGIVAFALRAHGPAVKRITNSVAFEHNATFFDSDPFYVLILPPESQQQKGSALKTSFQEAAEEFRLFSWFISVTSDVLPRRFAERCGDAVTGENLVVFKDDICLVYAESTDESSLTTSVSDWILRERYPFFRKLDLSALWDFGAAELVTSKRGSKVYRLVALFLLPQTYQTDPNSKRFFELGDSLARQRLKHLSNYLFGWSEAHVALSELSMVNLSPPTLVVVDPVTQVIYLNPNQSVLGGLYTFEQDVVISFLLAVSDGRVQGFGGNTFFVRLQRLGRLVAKAFMDMFANHPLISLLMLGIPTALLSFVGYVCCCLDDQYDDDELEKEVAKLIESEDYHADSLIDRDYQLRSRIAVQDPPDVDMDSDEHVMTLPEIKKTR